MKSFGLSIVTALILAGILLLFINSSPVAAIDPTAPDKSDSTPEKVFQSISAFDLPVQINLAGETVPLHKYDVKERLDRELLVNCNWHSSTIRIMKLSSRYFPIIEPILREKGVPEDFKYLAVAESGLTNAVSSARAEGVWQFLKGTAQDYGLQVTEDVDERYHLEKATRAACDYLIKSKDKFGSWTLAAAAYNAGKYNISQRLENQMVDNYYDLKLSKETSRYVFRILAFKEIMSKPDKYGFFVDESHLYQPIGHKLVEVESIENIAAFAKRNQSTYKEIMLMNPWLRKNYLKKKTGKLYQVKVPVE